MATPDHGYSLVEMMEPTEPTHTRKSPAAATSTSNKGDTHWCIYNIILVNP